MRMEKSPPELVARFAAIAPTDADVEHRKMFGYPACFVNGNMFTGLHASSMIVRLGEPGRTELLRQAGAELFEPMPGRPMKEYVVLPTSIVQDDAEVGRWLAEALAYGRALPPKEKKPAGSRKKA